MGKRTNITPAELLRKVKQLEISTRQKTKDMFSGGYQSHFKGMGITFSEVRQYQYGDDVRSIDWSVTAKTGITHIKVFEEERELSVLLVVDISDSTLFGVHGVRISEQVVELCASLAVTTEKNGDKIGLMLFASEKESFLPPKKGKTQLMKLLRELILLESKDKKTNIGASLKFLRRVAKKQHLIFVISDFMDLNYTKELSLLAQRHEVIGIRIWDSFYDNIPSEGLVRTIDPETREERIIDFGGEDRMILETTYRNYTAYFEDAFIRARAKQLTIKTGDSIHKSMLGFFNHRNSAIRR